MIRYFKRCTHAQAKAVPLAKDSHTSPNEFTQLFPSAKVIQLPIPKAIIPEKKSNLLSHSKILKISQLEERVASIQANLTSGKLIFAENMFNKCYRSNGKDFLRLINLNLINQFIQMNISVGSRKRALDWYKRLQELGMEADVTTFSLLIQYNLSLGESQTVQQLVEDAYNLGLTHSDFLNHDIFSDQEERSLLNTFFKKYNPSGLHNLELDESMQDDLLECAIQDQEQQQQKLHDEAQIELQELDAGSVSLLEKAAIRLLRKEKISKRIDLATTNALGVKILKKTLSELNSTPIDSKYDQQSWLEERAFTAALEERDELWKKIPDSAKNSRLPPDILWNWHKTLVPKIKEAIDKLSKCPKEDSQKMVVFLKLLAPELLSRITIFEVLKPPSVKHNNDASAQSYERKAAQLMSDIGNSVRREYNLQQMKKNKNKEFIKTNYQLHQLHSNGKLFNMALRKIAADLQNQNDQMNNWVPIWPLSVVLKVGSVLSNELLNCAKLTVQKDDGTTVQEPAFFHDYAQIRNTKRSFGVVRFHDALNDLIVNQNPVIHPWLLPMIAKPRAWLTWTSGGYHSYRQEVVRIHNNPEHRDYLAAADDAKNLQLVLSALDILGMTPWVINKDIFHIAAQMWNEGMDGPCMPSKLDPAPIPKPLDYESNAESKKLYNRALKKRKIEIQNNFSQRCDVNYKIEVARAFLNEAIYFPHNMDFRGRAYPMPPHLNHLGNDLCRGLLMFAEARPLGVAGLRWLKIQVSSLMGHDKVSFDDRVKYTEEHMQDVFDSVDNPLSGKKWWLSADKPWQCLAACFELAAAMRSSLPEAYLSRIPIHQDGSCNGLQHYAALGGDTEGALAVNLIPSEKPQDVYQRVADKMRELIKQDVENGDVVIAKKLLPRITRKLVKQTVMTNTYGVTFIGAREQVMNRLKEASVNDQKLGLEPLDDKELWSCSMYAAKKIFESMGYMFSNAREIQNWLNRTATLIAKSIPPEEINPEELSMSEDLLRLGIVDAPKVKGQEPEESLLDAVMQDAADPKPSETSSEILEEGEQEEESEDFELPEVPNRPPVILPANKRAPEKMTSVIWTTPLGLPVVQPYRNWKSESVDTVLQSFTVADPSIPSPVNPQKQSTAFPPNFVHSLDASHMMLSALACQKANIVFASVHDSYWTHACDVDKMNEILRDAFVSLHSENVMERLLSELLQRYSHHRIQKKILLEKPKLELLKEYYKAKGKKFSSRIKYVSVWLPLELKSVPKKGDLNLELVKSSQYFFH